MINIIYNYFISFYCSFVIWEGLYLETRLLRTVNVLPPDQLMSCSLYRHKLVLCQVYSKKYFRQFLSGFSFEKLSTWIWCLSKSLYYLLYYLYVNENSFSALEVPRLLRNCPHALDFFSFFMFLLNIYIICTGSLARRRCLGSACFQSPVTEPPLRFHTGN